MAQFLTLRELSYRPGSFSTASSFALAFSDADGMMVSVAQLKT